MQVAYNRAQVGTRAAEWINPKQGELLIPDRVSAYKLISQLESQLKTCHPRHKRAELLIARSMVYEAIGDQKMMEAAEEAFTFTKTSTTAHMMAVAHHHFGRIHEACNYYTLAFRFPHEQGFNVDLAYTQALLFQGKWSEAHQMTLGLKKRMVYAAYLPEWDKRPCERLSVISEGGFGDLIQCGRWIPELARMCKKVTVYLPPFFFDAGFVALWRKQPWCPEIKLLTEVPQKVPAVGFFDLPAIFDVQPNAIPPSLSFKADSVLTHKYRGICPPHSVGFCWAARQQETPLVEDGSYRALAKEQVVRIIQQTSDKVSLVSLQLNETLPGLLNPEIRSWDDTAAIIENLDGVITVDTGVMHLAAAMGKKVWVLLSGASDWKFGMEGDTCPWYPTIRLFRNNDWGFNHAVDDVIAAIRNEGMAFVPDTA